MIELQLVERLNARIDEEDARAVERMAGGVLPDFAAYRFEAGYRRALADVKTLINETLDDILKE